PRRRGARPHRARPARSHPRRGGSPPRGTRRSLTLRGLTQSRRASAMPAAAAASGSILGGGGETQKATTLFAPLFGTGFGGAATSGFDDAHAAQPILIAGTMSNLNIRLDQTEAVAATSYVFTVRKDATTATMADTTLTCTV